MLNVNEITTIESIDQIQFSNSPINFTAGDTAARVKLFLYVWNGKLQVAQPVPFATLYKERVSLNDRYIHLEISDYLRSFLVAPPNALNTSQPAFAYNALANPSITGQGCFYQIKGEITTDDNIVQNFTTETNFATLGYMFSEEQTYVSDKTITSNYSKYYNDKIHNYIKQSFDLTVPLAIATSANIIKVDNVTPNNNRCTQQPYLIVYLNKIGLFEMFTPFGKVAVSSKIESETTGRSYRRPSTVDNSFMHSEIRNVQDVTRTYSINTGSLRPEMVGQIEEIILSPKVFLIEFAGDVHQVTTQGITIDNNYITIDSLNVIIDGLEVQQESLAKYKTHKQIPVTVTNSDFEFKTRLNNKNALDFTLQFKETTNRINNIR